MGVGLADGGVFVFDLRVSMPLSMVLTRRVHELLPVSSDHTSMAFLVSSPVAAEIKFLPKLHARARGKPSFLYPGTTPIRCAIAHEGGAVLVDDESSSFIHCVDDVPMFRMFDGFTDRLTTGKNDRRLTILPSTVHGPSVHQHSGQITCGETFGDSFVTCDDLGFVNLWNIKTTKRKGT
jgi:hypothetical protein